LLVAAISPADLHDSHGGVALLRASRDLWPFLAYCFADRAYRGERVGTATAIIVEVVEPEAGKKGFAIHPNARTTVRCTILPVRRSSGQLVFHASGWLTALELRALRFG
jgi:hypothetical protein